jgi:hypothetical protein
MRDGGENRLPATMRNAARPKQFDKHQMTCDIGASSAHADE